MLEKERIPDYDILLVDYLTFTLRGFDLETVIDLLGLNGVNWEQIDRYMNGYPHRKFFGGISVMYGGTDEMGICVSMSGQGCRTYETYGANDFFGLFVLICNNSDVNITRLDIAFDDHSGILDLDRLRVDTDMGYYLSKSRKWTIEYGSDGCTLYFGSKKSNMLIRIYDKAAERGFGPDVHWIRTEIQMRDEIALGFARGLMTVDLGTQFRGVLHNYLRFVEPSEDSNKSRWPLTDYWDKLLAGVAKIRCWSSPGVEYNMANLENFVVQQAGSAIDTYLRVWGPQRLIQKIRERNVPLSPKYKRLLDEFGRKP